MEKVLAYVGVIYPTLHQLLPVILKGFRVPAAGETGPYVVLYNILDYFSAGNGAKKDEAK